MSVCINVANGLEYYKYVPSTHTHTHPPRPPPHTHTHIYIYIYILYKVNNLF